MTDSMYLGTTQISRNLNEHYYYLISTTSVIWQRQIVLQSGRMNTLLFHMRLERLKLIF